MKFPIQVPPARAALGIALVAVVAVVVVDGTGLGASARNFVAGLTAKAKRLFSK